MTPANATYQRKNSNLVISKAGYLSFDFIPRVKEEDRPIIDYQNRKTFILHASKAGDILEIDTTAPYDEETDS